MSTQEITGLSLRGVRCGCERWLRFRGTEQVIGPPKHPRSINTARYRRFPDTDQQRSEVIGPAARQPGLFIRLLIPTSRNHAEHRRTVISSARIPSYGAKLHNRWTALTRATTDGSLRTAKPSLEAAQLNGSVPTIAVRICWHLEHSCDYQRG